MSLNDNVTGASGSAAVAMSTAGMIAFAGITAWLLPEAPESLMATPIMIAVALLVVASVAASLGQLSVDRRWGRSRDAERSVTAVFYQHIQQAWIFAAVLQLVILSIALVAAPERMADWLWRSWALLLVGGGVVLLAARLIDLLIYLIKHERG